MAADAQELEALVPRILVGEAQAWQRFVEVAWPEWLGQLRSSRTMRGKFAEDDHVLTVATRVLEKLGRENGAGLVSYAEWAKRNKDKTIIDWLRIVVANSAREYVRTQLGDTRRPEQPNVSLTPHLDEAGRIALISAIGIDPGMTVLTTAQEMLSFARRELAPEQFHALLLWLRGTDFVQMALEVGAADADAAERLVRSALAVLRREFDVIE